MGLIRTAFWAGVIVMLLPTDEVKQRELLANAEQKIDWVMTYCDRKPETCDKAGAAWSQFVQKARFGAEIVTEIVKAQMGKRTGTAETAAVAAAPQTMASAKPVNTLTGSDLLPAWGG